jgi:hypothetical protein
MLKLDRLTKALITSGIATATLASAACSNIGRSTAPAPVASSNVSSEAAKVEIVDDEATAKAKKAAIIPVVTL